MGVLILDHTLGDLAGEGISNRDINVIGGDGEGFDHQRLNDQTGDDFVLIKRRTEISVQIREKGLSENHIRLDAQIAATSLETFHMLHLHASQTGQLIGLLGNQGA